MRLIARLTALSAALILVVSCLGDPTGPSTRIGGLALQPRFANAMAAAIVDIRDVRVVLRRPGESRIVVDTTVPFPSTRDTLVLGVEVPLAARTEQMELTLAMTNSLGDTVFRAGPILVTASTDPSGQAPAEPLFTYVGTGADASGVRFVQPPAAVLFGQSVTLVAEAFDAQQAAIVGTPVGFELVNPADSMFAKFTPAGSATLVAGMERASVQVRAVLPGGQSAVHTIAVQPAGAFMTAVSGNQQSGAAGTLLAEPLVAQILGFDELPVVGEIVEFSLRDSAQQILFTQRDTSDASGMVSLALTLPEVAGPHTVTATAVSNVEATVTYSVQVTAGAAAALQIVDQPATGVAGQALTPALEVHVLDAWGNLDETATDPVTVAIGTNPAGDGQLSGTLQVTPVNGVAMFTNLSVQRAAAGYTLVATSGALTSATTAPIEIVAGAPAGLAFTAQPPLAVVVQTPFAVVVGAVDTFGNPTPGWSGTVSMALDANPGQGTLGGTLTRTSVNGSVTFDDLFITSVSPGYVLGASSSIGAVSSNPFDVNPPPAVVSWVNAAGGNWSDGANWSGGAVPTSSDTVWVKLAGTYSVNVDVPITVSRMEMGATSGVQTLVVPTGAQLTVADSAFFGDAAAVSLVGGSIAGSGYVEVARSLLWTAGGFSGGGLARVLSAGTLTIGAGATHSLEGYTLELAGAGTWTGLDNMDSGQGAVFRVLPVGTLDIQGDPQWMWNTGGIATRFEVQGTLTRTTSTGIVRVPDLTVSGSATISSGTLVTRGAFEANGTYNVNAGATLEFTLGTGQLGDASTVQGAGTVRIAAGGEVQTAGAWAVTGVTDVQGTFTYDGAAGSTGTLLLSGTRRGVGTLEVTGGMTWAGGYLLDAGTTRVAAAAALSMTGATTERQLSAHTLEVFGPTTWDDGMAVNAGVGARLINFGAFTWSGAGDFRSSLAPPLATFENRGAFVRSGAAMVRMDAVMVDTIGVDWRLEPGGGLQLSRGARMGGSPFTGAVLELTNGTLSMEDGTAWIADGGVVRVTGGVVTVDSAATASFSTLELMAGALTHEGTVEITGNMQWQGGTISSNTSGLGGTTRLLPGVAMGIDGPAVKSFTGTHVIDVAYDGVSLAGQIVFDGTGDLNAGAGARILNSGRVWMQGSGAMLSNLGPPMAVLQNTVDGALEATTGALVGTRTMGFALDNVGSIFVNNQSADTLQFTGGSVGNFGGAMSVEVGALSLGAGTFTLTAALNVTAPLAITGSALLDLGADTALIGGDLTLSGGGRIQSTSDLAMLQVDGNATFGGGAGIYSAGRLDIGGNFVQTGPTNSFQATGTHVTRFVGMVAQSIGFSSPGLVTSQFRNLEIANMSATDSVVLASNAYVTDSLYVLTGRIGGIAPHRLVVGGNVNLVNLDGSNFIRPFVLEVGSLFTNDVGGITPDTLVLNRAGTYAWRDFSVPFGPHLRFTNGTISFDAASVAGDLTASNLARIVVPDTGSHAVQGNFETQGGGTLQMTAGSALDVNGSATFGGGGTTGSLAGGTLRIARDFVQSAAQNQASFAPSGSHITFLDGDSTQTISFATPLQSHFRALHIAAPVSAPRDVVLASDVRVVDSLTMNAGGGQSNMMGDSNTRRLVIGGLLRMASGTASPRLGVPVVELSRFPAIAPITEGMGGFVPDTAVLTGDMFEIPNGAGIFLTHVRVATTGEVSVTSPDTIPGDLSIESGFVNFGTPGFLIGGNLSTSRSGSIAMNAEAQVTVQGDAMFSGESTAGQLAAGTLFLRGAFAQLDGSPSSFSADSGHVTVFQGADVQTIRFTNPGADASTSHFGTMEVANVSAGGLLLETPVHAVWQLTANPNLPGRDLPLAVTSEVGDSLMVEGVNADRITFTNVPLRIGPAAPLMPMDGFMFDQMSLGVDQLVISRLGGEYTFDALAFTGEPPQEPVYFLRLVNLSVDSGFSVIVNNGTDVVEPFPFALQGEVRPSLMWNGVLLDAQLP